MYASAGSIAVNVWLAAVAIRARRITSLANALDDSMRAAAALGGAGVTGSREQLRVGRVALQRPAERVLAAPSSDDQDSHFFLLNASVNAWAARLAVSTTSFTTAFASFM